MGDSIIVGFDTYDLKIYAMGKGPSAMTAAAGPKVTTAGSSVVIEGTVLDNSPGLSSTATKLRFPNGVAAVSDASQSDWMMYVYKQFECPTNTTGVPVSISVIDANGNYRTIGTTTTDTTGYYSFNWAPDIAGQYTVYVTFAGSKAYYGSVATNSFVVDDAPAATTQPTAKPDSPADLYFVPAIAGLFVLVIIVLVMLVLLMRKRP